MLASMLLILTLLPVNLLTADAQNYNLDLTVLDAAAFTNCIYSTDMILAVLYGPTSPNASVYTGYNWSPLSQSYYEYFQTPPNCMSYYWSSSIQQHTFLYGDNQGDVMKKSIQIGHGSEIVTLWTIEGDDNNVANVEASPDQTLCAAFCQNSNQVYIMDLNVISDLKIILNYTASISSIEWKPNIDNQLAISGGNSTNTFFLLYDYSEQTELDLSFITNALVTDMAFSPDGSTLYYITDQPVINVYNTSTQTSSTLTTAGAQGMFSGVQVEGNFVTSWNGESVFIWNRITGVFYGQYASKLTTSGLSPDGNNLVTLDFDNTAQLNILELCQNGSLYDSASNACIPCDSPCQQCFLQPQDCSSCLNNSYLTSTFVCQLCSDSLTGCSSCSNSTYCLECNSTLNFVLLSNNTCSCNISFLQVNSICQPCINHCLECSDLTTCQLCDMGEHYVVDNSSCVCQDTYFQENGLCLPCYQGCYSCISATSCQQCNTNRNWQMIDGSCQCLSGYAAISEVCVLCSVMLDFCQDCTTDGGSLECSQCQEGYELAESSGCVEEGSSKVWIWIVVGVAGVIVLIVGVYFLWKYCKSRNQGNTALLETQVPEIYH